MIGSDIANHPTVTEAASWVTSTEVLLSLLDEEPGLFAVLAFFLLAGFAIMAVGGKQFNTGRLIKNTPPEKVRSMAVGRTELHGKVRDAGVTFDQPLTGGKCVYYRYSIQEEREWKEKNDDGETETKREWKTVSSHSLAAPFYLDDGTGEVLVLGNAGANFHISGDNKLSKTFRGSKRIPGKYRRNIDTSVDIASAMPDDVEINAHNLSAKIEDKIPLLTITGAGSRKRARTSGSPKQPTYEGSGRGRVKRRRVRQEVLPVDEDVYVYGAATIRDGADSSSNEASLVIQGDDDTGRFIISCKDEEGVAKRYTRMGALYFAGGMIVSVATFYFLVTGI